jgi:transcriptional regulator GlxA family with amidase domain
MDIGFESSPTGLSTELRPSERPLKYFRHEQDLHELAVAHDYDARRIARHLGISGRQLQRIFKARLNRSPALWLREQRLLRARQMLHTSCSVKGVAYSLGFRQVSQFCRDFKACFGYRPSADLPRSKG